MWTLSIIFTYYAVAYKHAYLQKHQRCIPLMGIHTTVVSGKHVNEREEVINKLLHTLSSTRGFQSRTEAKTEVGLQS